MAELTSADYTAFLAGTDTQSAIDSVLAAARRYCGWHVSPVETDSVTLDGPGGVRLFLKTKNLVSLISVNDAGTDLVVGTDVVASADVPGMLVRQNALWSSTYAAITVSYSHGFTEAEAADWRRAVLQMTRLWLNFATRDTLDMKRKRVRDVEYDWFQAKAATVDELATVFSQFRIVPVP
jgi:hypothetical protein